MRMNVFTCFLSVGLLFCYLPGASAIPLQNGDFASFTGWEGSLYGDTDSTLIDPAADASHFSLSGSGQAQLFNDDKYWEVALFQSFDLPTNALNLSFDFAWEITDPSFDFVQAVLIDSASNYYDLFPVSTDFSLASNSGIATTNIAALAGQAVTIEFLLQDGDFIAQDIFTVGNIQISQISVPEPGTLFLFGAGILGMVLRARFINKVV